MHRPTTHRKGPGSPGRYPSRPGGGFYISDFEPYGSNSSGDLAFAADLSTGGEGAFLLPAGSARAAIALARHGEPAPGGGVFEGSTLGHTAINNAGDLAFVFGLKPFGAPALKGFSKRDRQFRFLYEALLHETGERTVDPYAKLRTYPVSRMRHAVTLIHKRPGRRISMLPHIENVLRPNFAKNCHGIAPSLRRSRSSCSRSAIADGGWRTKRRLVKEKWNAKRPLRKQVRFSTRSV
jgi:hypothetical protein